VQDWRKRETGKALAVVRPGSTPEVAAVVKACAAAAQHRAARRQHRHGGGLDVPDASGTQVVLSLTRMNKVRTLDAGNLTMTVDAGCVLQNLQEACEKAGFLFPLSLARRAAAP
jgi:FAD/FMN-containing dehydrogenase